MEWRLVAGEVAVRPRRRARGRGPDHDDRREEESERRERWGSSDAGAAAGHGKMAAACRVGGAGAMAGDQGSRGSGMGRCPSACVCVVCIQRVCVSVGVVAAADGPKGTKVASSGRGEGKTTNVEAGGVTGGGDAA